MFIDIGFSLLKGALLGGTLSLLGYVLDYTISSNSQERIVKEKAEYFVQAHKYIVQNLMLISPTVYMIVDMTLLDNNMKFYVYQYIGLLLTQNIGYFFVHREMHRNRNLYKFHQFHHNFDNVLTPSIGNAVSPAEFCIAYICPFVLGAFLFTPTEVTYLASIGTVGIGNLVIHTYELNNIGWIPGFVSPTKHIKHHEVRDKHFAAPIFDIDAMFEYVMVQKNG